MKLEIKSWHGIVICGAKGTGKTYLEKYLLKLYPPKSILVFDPLDEFNEYPHYVPLTNSPKELEKIAKAVWQKGNTLFVVSEAELFLPVGGTLLPYTFKLVAQGRHRNIGVLADTRRIASLNKTVFSLSEWVFMFRHFSPNDARYLNEFLPIDARTLSSLEDYHFAIFHRNIVEFHEPVKL